MSCDCEHPDKQEELDRRTFFTRIILGIGALIAGSLAVPLGAAMLDPVLRKTGKDWRAVGKLDDFKVDETKMVSFKNSSPYKWTGKVAYSAAYIRRSQDDSLTAFSVNCAHLGCPVRWEEKEEMFLCPCHGGVYYKDGSRAAGPPTRGLFTYPARVRKGQVEIQTADLPISTLSNS